MQALIAVFSKTLGKTTIVRAPYWFSHQLSISLNQNFYGNFAKKKFTDSISPNTVEYNFVNVECLMAIKLFSTSFRTIQHDSCKN